jgi:hypothetical protein
MPKSAVMLKCPTSSTWSRQDSSCRAGGLRANHLTLLVERWRLGASSAVVGWVDFYCRTWETRSHSHYSIVLAGYLVELVVVPSLMPCVSLYGIHGCSWYFISDAFSLAHGTGARTEGQMEVVKTIQSRIVYMGTKKTHKEFPQLLVTVEV